MKNNTAILSLAVGGLLTLATGCGKPENTAPPGTEAERAIRAPGAEPAPTPERSMAPTDPVAVMTEPARPALPAAGHPADTGAMTPTNRSAPAAVGATPLAPDKPPGAAIEAQTTLAGLSQDQVAQGLKDALAKGLQQAIAGLGHDGGFLTNLNVRIPMPEKMQTAEKALRAIKQDKLADDFVVTMNHAAEQAVPEAGAVFADALKQMSIEDARAILSGPNDAATQYFQKTAQANLYARFYPIVQKATAQAGVTSAYKRVMEKASVTQGLGSLGSALGGSVLGKDSMDIDAYVTNKALDGLFQMVAAEEQQIRQNPVARTTAALQKVFGVLKN